MKLEIDIALDRGPDGLRLSRTLEAPVMGVFGPSGAGKTTLLHAVAGLVRGCRGRIVLDGDVLADSERGVFVPPHKRRMGVAFQNVRLLPHYNVRGNLRYGCNRIPRRQRRLGMDNVVDLLGLAPMLAHHTRELSGGERQRVALGRALLASPRLLLLDEPLAGLDENLRYQILPFLARIRDELGIPILIVSHLLPEILELTDQMLVLDRGRALGCGTFVDLAQDPDILPLMHEMGLLNVLRLVVRKAGATDGVTHCGLAGAAGEEVVVRVPPLEAPAGAKVDATLAATAIALAVRPVEGISMQNQLRGRVERIIHTPQRCLCLVDVGCPLLVEITEPGIRSLALAEGRTVWCLFKAHSLRILRG